MLCGCAPPPSGKKTLLWNPRAAVSGQLIADQDFMVFAKTGFPLPCIGAFGMFFHRHGVRNSKDNFPGIHSPKLLTLSATTAP
jgi:hypothetical protein